MKINVRWANSILKTYWNLMKINVRWALKTLLNLFFFSGLLLTDYILNMTGIPRRWQLSLSILQQVINCPNWIGQKILKSAN